MRQITWQARDLLTDLASLSIIQQHINIRSPWPLAQPPSLRITCFTYCWTLTILCDLVTPDSHGLLHLTRSFLPNVGQSSPSLHPHMWAGLQVSTACMHSASGMGEQIDPEEVSDISTSSESQPNKAGNWWHVNKTGFLITEETWTHAQLLD